MAKKDDLGANLCWIFIVSLAVGLLCGITAEATHWLLNVALGIVMGFLSLVSLSSAFLSK